VVVAHLGSGVDARHLNLYLAGDLRGVVVGPLELPVELVELAAHRGNGKVLGRESERRMRFVDLVCDHLVLLEFSGGGTPQLKTTTCLRKQLFQAGVSAS
jgi:hypothetical protein